MDNYKLITQNYRDKLKNMNLRQRSIIIGAVQKHAESRNKRTGWFEWVEVPEDDVKLLEAEFKNDLKKLKEELDAMIPAQNWQKELYGNKLKF